MFGEYLLVPVIAAGYHPSGSYTATLSNIPVATTTTTTIPGQTCLPGSCNDHDDCTVDSCVGGACAQCGGVLVRKTNRKGSRVVCSAAADHETGWTEPPEQQSA